MKIKTSKQIRKMNMEQIDKYETQLLKNGKYVPAVVKEHMRDLWLKKWNPKGYKVIDLRTVYKIKKDDFIGFPTVKKYTSIPSYYLFLTAIVWLYGLMLLLIKN